MSIQVIYITGFGRSGSTILDIVLGSAPNVFGCGELNAFVRSGLLRGEPCSCGAPVPDCSVWSEVVKAWPLARDKSALRAYSSIVDKADRSPLIRSRVSARAWDFFRRHSADLYQAISEVVGAVVLIESSKSPHRLRNLLDLQGIDFQAIHLIRDVVGVVSSMHRRLAADPSAGVAKDIPSRSPFKTVAAWRASNHSAERVCRDMGDRSMVVHMEQMISSPVSTFEQVARHYGLDLTRVCADVAANQPIPIHHPVAGNRLRMQENLVIRQDAASCESGARSDWLRRIAVFGASRRLRQTLTGGTTRDCC